VAVVAFFLNVPLQVFKFFPFVVSVAGGVAFVKTFRSSLIKGDLSKSNPQRAATLGIALFVVVCVFLTYWGGYWLSHTADTFYHVKAVRELVANNSILVTNVFTPSSGVQSLDITCGTWHTILAVLAVYSTLDVTTVLYLLSGICTMLLILAFYKLSCRLLRNRLTAIAAVGLYFIIIRKLDFTTVFYPNRLAFVLLWIALLMLYDYYNMGGGKRLTAVAALSFTLASFHLGFYEAFIAVLLFFAFLVLLPWPLTQASRQQGKRRILLVLAVVLAASMPYVLLVSSGTSHSPSAMITGAFSGEMSTYSRYDDAPRQILLRAWKPVLSGALFSVLMLGAFVRNGKGLFIFSQVMITSFLAIFFLVLSAIVGSPLGILNYHLLRLGLTHYAAIISCGLILEYIVIDRKLFSNWKRRSQWCISGYYSVIMVALIGLIVWEGWPSAVSIYQRYFSSGHGSIAQIKASNVLKVHEDLLLMCRNLPSGSVILSDPTTSYEVPSLSSQYVVAVPWSHMPGRLDKRTRINEVWDFLYQNVSVVEAARILEKYNVDYVMAKPFFAERLKELPLLEEIASFRDGLVLYRYRRERIREVLSFQLARQSPALEVGGVEIQAWGVDALPAHAPGAFLAALDWQPLDDWSDGRRFLLCVEDPRTGVCRASQEVYLKPEQSPQAFVEEASRPVSHSEFLVVLPDLLPEGTYSLIMREEASSRGVQIGSINIFPQHDFEAESFVGVQFSKEDLTGNKTGWWLFERGFYSSGATALTKAVDSVISKSIQDLSGGTYEIALRVYDYGNSELNQLAVAIDSDQKIISWRANREGLRWVTTTVSIKGEMAKELVIRSVEFNPCIVLDIVSVKKVE